MIRRALLWTAAALLGAAWGCSAAGTKQDGEGTAANGTGAAGSGGASGGTGGIGIGLGGSAGSPCMGNGCSADLKSVVDCDGNVVETCPSEQACLGGACVDDPCAAAEASKSSIGCDYWALKTDLIWQAKGACFAAYVVNTWSSPAHLHVYREGKELTDTGFIRVPVGQGSGIQYQPYDPSGGLPSGQVAILFLSDEAPIIPLTPLCPAPPGLKGESGVVGTGRGRAFHIQTDKPVVAYTILPYGGGAAAMTSASLLLPTSAWDTNYITINAYEQTQVPEAASSGAHPSLAVLASEDGTVVTIQPKVAIEGGNGVDPTPANASIAYQLSAGEYLQISQTEELTGSALQSNKPVGVWGAASCLNILPAEWACDSAHQQIPPVRALGSEYALVRYRNRKAATGEETPPWRLVGAVDGTELSWQPAPPDGAPATLALGQVYELQASGPYLVASQDAKHPFYAAGYMTGADHIAPDVGEGDPEWVNVVPTDQFLQQYIFFTDPTYPETSLVVVRAKSKQTGQFADVKLDCAGPLGGWQPIGELEYTRIDLVTGNFENIGGCSNGRHQMDSDAPFGVTVWGWGGYSLWGSTYVSYAYPAGAGLEPINDVVVPVPPPK
jgi:hypothetical protein